MSFSFFSFLATKKSLLAMTNDRTYKRTKIKKRQFGMHPLWVEDTNKGRKTFWSTGSRTKSPATSQVTGLNFRTFRLLHLRLHVRASCLRGQIDFPKLFWCYDLCFFIFFNSKIICVTCDYKVSFTCFA